MSITLAARDNAMDGKSVGRSAMVDVSEGECTDIIVLVDNGGVVFKVQLGIGANEVIFA